MNVFDEIAFANKRIKDLEEKMWFLEVQTLTPRTTTYSDMPKGRGKSSNPIEEYAIKHEYFSEKLEKMKQNRDKKWNEAKKQMMKAEIDTQAIDLMRYRYLKGVKWSFCTILMNRRYPDGNWNENKCFKEHKKILQKITKIY